MVSSWHIKPRMTNTNSKATSTHNIWFVLHNNNFISRAQNHCITWPLPLAVYSRSNNPSCSQSLLIHQESEPWPVYSDTQQAHAVGGHGGAGDCRGCVGVFVRRLLRYCPSSCNIPITSASCASMSTVSSSGEVAIEAFESTQSSSKSAQRCPA